MQYFDAYFSSSKIKNKIESLNNHNNNNNNNNNNTNKNEILHNKKNRMKNRKMLLEQDIELEKIEKIDSQSFVLLPSMRSGSSRWKQSHHYSQSDSPIEPPNTLVKNSTDLLDFEKDPLRPLTTYSYQLSIQQIFAHKSMQLKSFFFNRATNLPIAQTLYVVAWTRVDSQFAEPGQGFPAGKPQSHYANIRTDTKWEKNAYEKKTKGRVFWPSDPIVFDLKQYYKNENNNINKNGNNDNINSNDNINKNKDVQSILTLQSKILHCASWNAI
jgi:hypothetical protein